MESSLISERSRRYSVPALRSSGAHGDGLVRQDCCRARWRVVGEPVAGQGGELDRRERDSFDGSQSFQQGLEEAGDIRLPAAELPQQLARGRISLAFERGVKLGGVALERWRRLLRRDTPYQVELHVEVADPARSAAELLENALALRASLSCSGISGRRASMANWPSIRRVVVRSLCTDRGFGSARQRVIAASSPVTCSRRVRMGCAEVEVAMGSWIREEMRQFVMVKDCTRYVCLRKGCTSARAAVILGFNTMSIVRAVLLLFLFTGSVLAQAANEQGKFILHKFAKAIGEESYTVEHANGMLTLKSDFLFTDRGTKVPLKTTFIATDALEPVSLTLEGQSSRMSVLKDMMEYHAATQKMTLTREGKTRDVAAPAGSFLVDGYSPVVMQQMLMRFWLSHGNAEGIPTPPTGGVTIVPAGALTVTVAGKAVKLEGYVVSGLIWGGETLWMDEQGNLAALISTDAEFDHFEAVRDVYESALAIFIQTAAKDNLAALAKLTAKAKRPAAKQLVVSHVTLIDGTGKPPVKDATIFVEDGKIQASLWRRSQRFQRTRR